MASGNWGMFSSPVLSVGGLHQSSGSATGFNLTTAFVKGTSGAAFLVRYVCRTADPIDALWVFVHAFTGTVTAMQCDIYNENAWNLPGATLRDSSTAVSIPAGATQWMKFTFGTPYTPTVGEVLWFIVHNTTATPASNYPTIRTATTTSIGASSDLVFRIKPFTTSTGATTTGATYEAPCVVKQGSNYFGQPLTIYNGGNFLANDSNEKGMQFTVPTGLIFNIYGYETTKSTSLADTAKLYADATAPGGTVLASWDLDSDTNETTNEAIGCKIFDTAYAAGAGTYKFVFDPGGNMNLAGMEIEDYASYSTEFDAMFDMWKCTKPVIENAGSWTVDGHGLVDIRLLIEVTAAASGGGTRGYAI